MVSVNKRFNKKREDGKKYINKLWERVKIRKDELIFVPSFYSK